MVQIHALLLIGPTGAGKTPLGEEMEKRGILGKKAHHFDFGENLRKAAKNLLPLNHQERLLIQHILLEGRLLKPEEFFLAKNILSSFLEQRNFKPDHLLILNGLPRNIYQATALTSLIEISYLVFLEVDLQTLKIRLKKDPAGDRKGREDDHEAYLAKKLDWFQRETLPLIDFYEKRNTKIITIKVNEEDTGQTLYKKLITLI
uniref:Adenylate kinase n=1 Tax=Caldimicrobium thiodismutans TaxID=1653476 RepID=A0A832GPQ1_9BACT